MPNHCFNTLILSGTTLPIILKNYIREDDNGEDVFDFEQIVPIGDIPDWYEQRIQKWGTKWVGYDLNIGDSCMDFYTAWSPPIPIIRKLAELHKDIVFRLEYYEPGMCFRGKTIAKWQGRDVLLDDTCWNMTDEDLNELGFL
ncbi:hypothetical protein FACS1894172_02840 [Spirochaetia bacterium]|nr:hypothetical protein FACS1894172_02840 [Spirochaetia bacterium]